MLNSKETSVRKSKISRLLDRFRRSTQELLAGWFETLGKTLENEDRLGHAIHKTWYQTEDGLKLEGYKSDRSVYNVRILQLPQVSLNRRKFYPELSETTLSSGIFPDTPPEIETWKLDLKVSDKSGKLKMPQVQFSRLRYHTPKYELKYEIRYADGKQLSSYEVNSVKSIYDNAIGKLSTI